MEEIPQLSALELNNTIVAWRKLGNKVKIRGTRKLMLKIKKLKKSKKEEKGSEQESKIERYLEEIRACKNIRADDLTKFALVNVKTLQQLNIRGNTPPETRALYKLATHGIIQKEVASFRRKYPNWHQEVPFLLQRLGLQYKAATKANAAPIGQPTVSAKKTSIKKQARNIDDDTKQVGKTSPSTAVTGSSELKKKRKTEKQKAEKEAPPAPVSIKQSVTRRGQAEIRRINLDEVFGDEFDEEPQPATASLPKAATTQTKPPSSFFIGGSDSEPDSEASDAEQPPVYKYSAQRFPKQSANRKPMIRAKPHKREERVEMGAESLHPSWKAKREAKLSRSKLGVKPQGKKIVFD